MKISTELTTYYGSLSFTAPMLASDVIREAMHGNIPEGLPAAGFDTDGESEDIGDVHTVYNQRADRFDVQATLSADEYRQALAATESARPTPTQENESQPAADSAE